MGDESVDIIIQEDQDVQEPLLVLHCKKADSGVLALAETLRAVCGAEKLRAQKLTGWRDGQAYPLDPGQVLYIDTVDKRTFLYTREGVYETSLRLYELEERLRERDFFRASKSALVNFNAIQSLRPDLGGRLRLTMRGGEALYVSRQYAPELKRRLGI